MTPFAEWENFYVIVGSSAGALIGLQFVVMTLIADKQVATSQALSSAFGTPNIIHFSAALLLSALAWLMRACSSCTPRPDGLSRPQKPGHRNASLVLGRAQVISKVPDPRRRAACDPSGEVLVICESGRQYSGTYHAPLALIPHAE